MDFYLKLCNSLVFDNKFKYLNCTSNDFKLKEGENDKGFRTDKSFIFAAEDI